MKIIKKNKVYFLNCENSFEENAIDNFISKKLTAKEISKDVICLIKNDIENDNKDNNSNKRNAIKEEIIELLNDRELPLNKKIKGAFEKLLDKKALEVFNNMLKANEIYLFKLSSKYKAPIYKVKDLEEINFDNKNKSYIPIENLETKITEDNTNLIENFNTTTTYTAPENLPNKNISNLDIEKLETDFEKKRFAIINNLSLIEVFSRKYFSKVKSGEIVGLKSFDGNYYIIYLDLYTKIKDKIFKIIKSKKSILLSEIAKESKLDIELIKLAIEFLKEECIIIEKKKEVFCAV
ncbi:MAG: hypothetical protein V1824_03730 [archaeon]